MADVLDLQENQLGQKETTLKLSIPGTVALGG